MSTPRIDVLVSSPDRNFRALARAVLRAQGHHVVATSLGPDRLPHQVQLRSPRVLVVDGPAGGAELRRCLAATGTCIVAVRERRPGEPYDPQDALSKWTPTALVAAVGEALDAGCRARPRLRLVES